jgi:hypothetical protein
MKWVDQWHVTSRSSGKVYTVSLADDGTWGCSCPRWIFAREDCKHIKEVKGWGVASQHQPAKNSEPPPALK